MFARKVFSWPTRIGSEVIQIPPLYADWLIAGSFGKSMRRSTCESTLETKVTCEHKTTLLEMFKKLLAHLKLWRVSVQIYLRFPLHPTVFGDCGFSYSLNCMHVP